MASDGEKTYSVGYGHPPQHTRFVKGQSANPKGRPRGSKNMTTLIDEALDERVTIKENGKTRRVTKRVAMAKQVVNKAAVGNLKAVLFLMLQLKERDKILLSSSEKDIAVRSTWDFDVNEERELTQWQSTIQTLLQRGMNPKELGITAQMLNSPEEEMGSSITVKADESTAIDRSKKVK
jgi:Family of unknown function (DUF5681)